MQRYNIFYQIHKGLKALLYETALEVQHTDFWNVQDVEKIIDRIHEVVRLFDKHAHTEDSFVFPAIESYEPSVADAFSREHVLDHQLGQALSSAIKRYQHSAIITEKFEAGKLIQSGFLKFLVFNIEHMLKEEDILNSLLWRYYSDAELVGITQEILANVPPDYMGQYSKWMMRGLNNSEISGWLREVEQTAPEPIFQHLFAAAEKELPQDRFRQVLEGLTDGAMLA